MLKGNKGEAGVDLFEKEKEETPVVVQVVQVQEEKKELTPEEIQKGIIIGIQIVKEMRSE